jgi:sterol 3beta-glucosyltransferase
VRALLYCFGTDGDIRPFIALGRSLIRAGHEATICTAEGFRAAIEASGVGYAFMNNEMLRLIQHGMPQMSGPRDAYKIIRAMGDAQRSALQDQWAAAQDFQPSIIVYHPKSLGGYHIAEKLGVPGVLSLALPFFTPTREFPIPFLSNLSLGGRVNRLTYEFQRFTALAYGGMLNDFRRNQLHLRPIRRTATLLHDSAGRPLIILYAFSRYVRPIPVDYPPNVHVTGYWFLDRPDDWQPSAALERFIADGPQPIYVGFGSMGFGKGAERRNKAIIDAIQRVGVRAVLATGWSQQVEVDLPDSVLMIDNAPHDWLFPKVSVVVHHGGAGTTGAGLRAGRPSLICPVLGDQPFWGHQVRLLGAGPDPLPQRQITAERLTDRLNRLVCDQTYRDRAEAVARLIETEDGPTRATAILESIQPLRR